MNRDSTTTLLRMEAGVVLALILVAYPMISGPGWLWFLVLLPDLSFAAYAAGPRFGAIAYNVAHTTLAPMLLGLAGVLTHHPVLVDLALIWAAHIAADRALGYGLKRSTGFGETHLSSQRPFATTAAQANVQDAGRVLTGVQA